MIVQDRRPASYHSNGTGHWWQNYQLFIMNTFPQPTPNYPKGAVDLLAPFNYLQAMKLLIDVEFALAGNESFAALAIKQAIRDDKPGRVIIDTIKDMSTDNYNSVADMIGLSLTNKILSL